MLMINRNYFILIVTLLFWGIIAQGVAFAHEQSPDVLTPAEQEWREKNPDIAAKEADYLFKNLEGVNYGDN